MEGLVDNRQQEEIVFPLAPDPEDPEIARAEAAAPRSVKVIFTPVRQGTLVTVVTQEWQGRHRVDTRILAVRLMTATRLGWSVDPQGSLRACIEGLAAYLEA